MRLKIASLRRVVKGDLRVEFIHQDLTSYGGLELVRRYFRLLDLHRRLRQAFSAYGLGGDYGCGRLVLLVVALFLVGARRLEHLRYVARDPLFARLCGLARIPTDRTVVNWLKQFTQEALHALITLNSDLLYEQIERLGLGRLTIDVDGTVVRTGNKVAWPSGGSIRIIGKTPATTRSWRIWRRPARSSASRTARATCTTVAGPCALSAPLSASSAPESLGGGVLAQTEHGRLGEGPLQMRIADLRAGVSVVLAVGLLGAFHQPAVGDEVLDAGEGRQGVLAGGVLDVGEQLGALAHEVAAPAQPVPRRAHLSRVDIRHRQHPPAHEHRDLVGVDPVVLGLAPVDRFHVQRVTEDEGNPLASAEVGEPVSGKDALHRHYQVVAIRRDDSQKVLGGGRAVPMDADLAFRIQHADVHPPSVQIDPTVVSVLRGVEPHQVSSFPAVAGVLFGRTHLTLPCGRWRPE